MQPFIFLGKVVYNGPVGNAKGYVERLGFKFDPGDSLPDFLIDVAAGEVEPSEYSRDSVIQTTTGEDEEGDTAGIRREHLFAAWDKHFSKMSRREKRNYMPPAKFDLPVAPKLPSFLRQFQIQLRRYSLVLRRNIVSKLVDTLIIVGAIILISMIEGIVEATRDLPPDVAFEQISTNNPDVLVSLFGELFNYALRPTTRIQE